MTPLMPKKILGILLQCLCIFSYNFLAGGSYVTILSQSEAWAIVPAILLPSKGLHVSAKNGLVALKEKVEIILIPT